MKKSWLPSNLIGALLLTSTVSLVNAQIDMSNVREGESVEYCKTHKKMAELKQNPAFLQQYLQDQQTLSNVEAQMKANASPKRVVYTIPIVFHVLHDGGAGNISEEQIIDQVNILNRDYRLQNADAANVQPEFNASNPSHVAQPADIEIEFRLATKAPNGACFNGITRTYSSLTNSGGGQTGGSSQVDAIKAGNDVFQGEWPGDKYLNVFVVADAGGAAGYTMTPNNSSWGGGTTMKNGIWILSTYIGSIGTGNTQLSRALTHEVGHWLNLQHTWGPNNNPGDAASCNTDDGVADTPNTVGVTSCKLQENTCGPKANVENYMDYSYCSKMFTEGQRDRMRAAIIANVGGRNNVISAANLVATGADGNAPLCKALFSASQNVICVGSTVTFNDDSYNNVQTRTWNFEGGTPATSTDKHPIVTYSTPGIYKVKLTVSDGSNSLDLEKTNYITVQGSSQSLPFYEGFESYTATSDLTEYQISNSSSNSKAWELTSAAAKSGSKSLYLNNFAQTGDLDEFISPNLDLSSVNSSTGVTLSYRYAAAKKTSAVSQELLKTFISNDCGTSYVLRKTLTGNQLTSTVSTSDWVPTASDWVTVHITNITSSYFSSNFRFKISYESKGGNNVYLDDINLYKGSPSDDVVLATSTLSSNINAMTVYPNPAEEELNVSFSAMNAGTYTVQIVDVVGKLISTYQVNANQGMNEVLINTDNLRKGAYFVRVSDNTTAKTLQFVKQ
jgi:PKD repeat protein